MKDASELYRELHEVLDAIANQKLAISYSFKCRFLDKCTLDLSYKNPDFVKPAKTKTPR